MYIIPLILFHVHYEQNLLKHKSSTTPYNMPLDLWTLYEASHDKEIDVKMRDLVKP